MDLVLLNNKDFALDNAINFVFFLNMIIQMFFVTKKKDMIEGNEKLVESKQIVVVFANFQIIK